MSETVKNINEFFRNALQIEVDDLVSKLALSERQLKVFEMFYIKRYDIHSISKEIGASETSVARELKRVRIKIAKVLGY